MSLLVTLIVGAIIGWLGAAIAGRNEGILGSIAIGIVGSLIGGALANMFGATTQSYLSFSWAGFVWSLIGAILLSAILNMMQHRGHHNV
jgi:uncharacterized membrane protein YeaQ/YmgE (transglycosylase-associated protein family)